MNSMQSMWTRIVWVPALVICFLGTLSAGTVLATDSVSMESATGGRFAPDLSANKVLLAEKGYTCEAPALAAALRDANTEIRARALMVLGESATGAQVPSMKRMLDDPERRVRETALYALDDVLRRCGEAASGISRSELKKAALALRSGPHDPLLARVASAALLLDIADDQSGVPDVLEALGNPNTRPMAAVVAFTFAKRGLRDSSGKEIDWVTPLAAIVRDKRTARVTKQIVVRGLYDLGNPQAKAALENLARTVEDEQVRATISFLKSRPSEEGKIGGSTG